MRGVSQQARLRARDDWTFGRLATAKQQPDRIFQKFRFFKMTSKDVKKTRFFASRNCILF